MQDGTPYNSITQNTIIEPKIRYEEVKQTIGYDAKMFFSLGYRYWKREIDKYGTHGYDEEYYWSYADIGIGGNKKIGGVSVGFEAAYQQAIEPELKAYLAGGMKFELGRTWGYNIKIPVRYDMGKNFFLEFAYEYDFWRINESNVVNGYHEPKSDTKNSYYTISWGMRF